LKESKEANDSVHIVKANHGLAAVAVLQGDFSAARRFLTEALARSREVGDELQTAHSLGAFGDLEMCQGDLANARPLLEEGLTLSKKLGTESILTTVYFNLGTIDYLESFYESAALNFSEALQISVGMKHRAMISCSLDGFAALAAAGGNYARSAELSGAAERLRDEIDYKHEPAEEMFREKYLAETRAMLDEKTFRALYERGRALNFDEAVALTNRPTVTNEIGPDEMCGEIVIEEHSFSRIVIEDELESGF
jgi:tetratricopeptide (TPR) repeat protein